ncbi:MAG: UDP-N-acetylmuramoyl-tripeptide--D-alanyl-D-alanine ligase, partial [Bacilli bacterium]|nr:UDP-N-acetylmuramoyl-tripeptide--D-alanyl-D-alanine ligase [Bacilli bacterium]
MKIKELLSITKGKLIGKINLNTSFKDIKINSKRIVNNDIFIPIIGNNKDGHDFIEESIKNGCILFLSSKYIEVNFPYILVEDTTKVLSLIAKYILDKYRPLVIGITGSMGKTTTRDMLYNVLKTKYKVQTNIKNYNNNIGIPLSIFKLKKDTQILILELGMNHYNEISYLSKLIKPDISVITNIGSSHIGNFKSKENIFKAKLEILDGMKDKILFINGDDEYLKTIMIDKLYKSGFNKDNDLIGYDLKTN